MVSSTAPMELRAVVLVAAALLCAGCAIRKGKPLPEIAEEINATLEPDAVVLQPGDSVAVRFQTNPEWNQTVHILPDGKGSFLFIGDLEIEGMTTEDLSTKLKELYAQSLVSIDLLVNATALTHREVIFLGAVNKPGTQSVLPFQTLEFVETLARAGGPIDTFAVLKQTLLIRWDPVEKVKRSWMIDARLKHWDETPALYLQAHDLVYVPRQPIKWWGDWVREITRLIPLPVLFTVY